MCYNKTPSFSNFEILFLSFIFKNYHSSYSPYTSNFHWIYWLNFSFIILRNSWFNQNGNEVKYEETIQTSHKYLNSPKNFSMPLNNWRNGESASLSGLVNMEIFCFLQYTFLPFFNFFGTFISLKTKINIFNLNSLKM